MLEFNLVSSTNNGANKSYFADVHYHALARQRKRKKRIEKKWKTERKRQQT